jgi:hypothetical protein
VAEAVAALEARDGVTVHLALQLQGQARHAPIVGSVPGEAQEMTRLLENGVGVALVARIHVEAEAKLRPRVEDHDAAARRVARQQTPRLFGRHHVVLRAESEIEAVDPRQPAAGGGDRVN